MLTPNRRTYFLLLLIVFFGGLSGCENTDAQLAAEAGIDAYKAITLSDQAVAELSVKSSAAMDSQHSIAPAGSTYAKRLQELVGDLYERDGYTFDYKVYLKDDVNAFAMADGTIRIYSGLMDLLEDGELRFVIGHEMGHAGGWACGGGSPQFQSPHVQIGQLCRYHCRRRLRPADLPAVPE